MSPQEQASYERRRVFACDVCGNIPDECGNLEHGRGCYTQSSDGGGESYVEVADDHREPETKPCPHS